MKKTNKVYGKRPMPSFRKVQQDFSGNRFADFRDRENRFLEKLDRKIQMADNPNITVSISDNNCLIYTV